jgi:hypothetical protein
MSKEWLTYNDNDHHGGHDDGEENDLHGGVLGGEVAAVVNHHILVIFKIGSLVISQ